MLVSNYFIILGRASQVHIGGHLSLDGTHMTISKGAKNIIIYREGWITPFVKGLP